MDYILFSYMFTDLSLKYISKEIDLQLQDLKRRGSEWENYNKCSYIVILIADVFE